MLNHYHYEELKLLFLLSYSLW